MQSTVEKKIFYLTLKTLAKFQFILCNEKWCLKFDKNDRNKIFWEVWLISKNI